MRKLMSAVLFCLAAGHCAAQQESYQLKHEEPFTGSRLRTKAAQSNIPFDKSWGELSETQQALIKSQYESMGPGDEPPYPLHGQKPFWQALVTGSKQLREKGDVKLLVEVDSSGNAVSVGIMKSPGDRLVQYLSAVILKEKFKPALCAGQPCAQQYLFSAQLVH